MTKLIFAGYVFFLLFINPVFAQQKIDRLISLSEVERIEQTLAANNMEGRKTFSRGIDKAADFIAAEFARSGLKIFEKNEDYFQAFEMVKATTTKATGSINGIPVSENTLLLFSSKPSLNINNNFTVTSLDTNKNLMQQAYELLQSPSNLIVKVPTYFTGQFGKLKRFNRAGFAKENAIVFVLTDAELNDYQFSFLQDIDGKPLKNVIGYLPGKTKPKEYIIFSAHYDHLGIGKPNAAGDSIYNGANDDAAGTTAVMMLAHYFSKLNNNERSIIFVAFTAEEIGGFGSQYFSEHINERDVVAMFNIEMIGTQSKWGANSAYITGFEKSDFGKILQQNLWNSKFKFEPDPYPKQQLFYRSDNARLAALGVPAHSISTAKMDDEPFYHKQGDEVSTLDLANMTQIIKAIALSSQTIISGKDTPTRVEQLK